MEDTTEKKELEALVEEWLKRRLRKVMQEEYGWATDNSKLMDE